MRVTTAYVADVQKSMRFDSRFFFDRGRLKTILEGSWPLATVGEIFSGRLLLPNIFERVPASSEEFGKRILVPYDCFRYMPYSNDILSQSQVKSFSKLQIKRGWLLMVCSGRNLGPVVIADRFLERFVLTHDMIRVCAEPSDDLFYFAAVMHTGIGQILVRTDRNGSVIDHLDDGQLGSLQYPLVKEPLRKHCANAFRNGFLLREKARLALDRLAKEFLRDAGLYDWEARLQAKDKARRFAIQRQSLTDRIDSEYFAPSYAAFRKMISDCGHARSIADIAHVMKPVGRYKTLYVEDEQYGIKILSGRQIAQFRAIGLKIMSKRAWKKPDEYLLKKGMVLLTSDGRAEENLGDCAMVRRDREDWTASGHVHRLVAKEGIHPGLLYLACSSAIVQRLLKSLATGSVIDALSVPDVQSVNVPYLDSPTGRTLGDEATQAWDWFAEAGETEDAAVQELEKEFAS